MTDMTQGASILVAVYNGAAYLDAQLQSIMGQASAYDEILVMDDRSSDDSRTIVMRYERAHPNLRLITSEHNRGVRATFEALLNASRRKIIILSDQDDIWMEGRRDRMVAALRQDDCVAVLANASVMTEHGTNRTFFPADQPPNVYSIPQNYLRNNFIGCCMAFRREVLALALPFPASISMHDWWLGSCAIALGDVRYLAEPSLLYRRHASNQSAGTRRSWRIVIKDRSGNLRALVALWRRIVHLRRARIRARV